MEESRVDIVCCYYLNFDALLSMLPLFTSPNPLNIKRHPSPTHQHTINHRCILSYIIVDLLVGRRSIYHSIPHDARSVNRLYLHYYSMFHPSSFNPYQSNCFLRPIIDHWHPKYPMFMVYISSSHKLSTRPQV